MLRSCRAMSLGTPASGSAMSAITMLECTLEQARPNHSSPCLLRLLKYQPQPLEERGAPQITHTDLDNLTVLFTTQPGLQVLPPGASEWSYVKPKEGHATINVGDGLAMMTNGLFESYLRHVSPMPNTAMDTRYSFAYLQRAEEHTPLTGLASALIPESRESDAVEDGRALTSGEWLHRKFSMLRANTRVEGKSWVLTDRAEALPA